MTPVWTSKVRKISLQALLGLAVAAVSNAGLAATALIKINISLPQVLTTSLSADVPTDPALLNNLDIQNHFYDSRNNGYLVRGKDSAAENKPVTYLYIQT
jgi:hypothetical protein